MSLMLLLEGDESAFEGEGTAAVLVAETAVLLDCPLVSSLVSEELVFHDKVVIYEVGWANVTDAMEMT